MVFNDAYFHVPIASYHRQLLCFAFEGRAYEFRVLPFCISLVARIFTRFLAAALTPEHARPLVDLSPVACAHHQALATSELHQDLTHSLPENCVYWHSAGPAGDEGSLWGPFAGHSEHCCGFSVTAAPTSSEVEDAPSLVLAN